MLKATPENLWREVQEAEKVRDERLGSYDDLVTAYHGPAYQGTKATSVGDPENASFEYLSLWTSRAVSGHPRVKIGTARKGAQRKVARALEHVVNRQVRDTRLQHTLEQWSVDFSFSWCIALTTLEENSRYSHEFNDPVLGPRSYRVDPKHFFWDDQALTRDECRYFGHDFPMDLDELKELAGTDGWRAKPIKALAEERDREMASGNRTNAQVARGEVTVREMWVGELDISDVEGGKYAQEGQTREDGFNGVIFTLDKSGAFLRDPRAFYGPRTGPYAFWGAYDVPGQVAPLAVLMATDTQRKALNASVRANERAQNRRKKIGVYNRRGLTDAKAIANAVDGSLVGVTLGQGEQVQEVELGGATDQGLRDEMIRRDRLHRMQGMSDAKRGGPQSDVTATADAIADEADTARMGFLLGRFQEGPRQILTSWAWYDYHDDQVIVGMPDEAQQEGFGPWYYGGSGAKAFHALLKAQGVDIPEEELEEMFPGIEEPGSGATFDDLELEIEFYSMARMTQAQMVRQATTLMELAVNSAPAIVQNPHVDWQTVYDYMGQTMGFPALGDIINPQLAYQLFGLQLALQAKQEQPQASEGPQTASTLGLYGRVQQAGSQAGQKPREDMAGPKAGAQSKAMVA